MNDFKRLAQEHLRLVQKIEDALEGEHLDNVVPTLTTFLAEAGWMSGMEKKRFITHVVDSIDRMFAAAERAEKNNEGDKG